MAYDDILVDLDNRWDCLSGKIFFWELVTLVDIMLVGHWIEIRSVMGASQALAELARLMPSDAHKIMPDGSIEDIPLDKVGAGDRVLVKPGEKIPVDGEAQESKSKSQDLANRAALWLTGIALTGGAVTLFVWLTIMHKDFAFALERTVTVMVITCPHALGIAGSGKALPGMSKEQVRSAVGDPARIEEGKEGGRVATVWWYEHDGWLSIVFGNNGKVIRIENETETGSRVGVVR